MATKRVKSPDNMLPPNEFADTPTGLEDGEVEPPKALQDTLMDDPPTVQADPLDLAQKYISPFREELDDREAARSEDTERIAGEVKEQQKEKKRGRSSWKKGFGGIKRDLMAFGEMRANAHPKWPNFYFRPVAMARVAERKAQGYRVASKEMLGDVGDLFGASKGMTSAVQRNEMVVMYHHKQYIEERREMVDMQTDAQESDLEAVAAAEGLKPVRPGDFGKGKLAIFNERHRGRMPTD